MDKPFDLRVAELEENLLKILEESKLPLTVCTMVVNGIATQVSTTLQTHIQKLKQEHKEG